ncbi:MAG: ATP-binding protein [bacterium]
MPGLPTGTVTFLFTDIEGSTRLLGRLGDRYAGVLAACRQLLRTSCAEQDGREIGTEGDGFFAVFSTARDALAAAVSAQRALSAQSWPDGADVRIRMGLHTGEAALTDAGYVGMDVHVAARICAAAHGGQVLLSYAAGALLARNLPPGVALRQMGSHRLKDLAEPQPLCQVVVEGLRSDFPLLRTLDNLPNNLPRQLTSFVGRDREAAEIKTLLAGTRLLTLTGAGGSGKTRLALQIVADLLDHYPDGVWLIELASLSVPALLPQAAASVLGVAERPGRPLDETLLEHLRSRSMLLVFDNCEHLLQSCASLVDVILRRCAHVRILATSREGLGIAGELTYAVPSLSVPDPGGVFAPNDLLRSEAARLFVERVMASNAKFRLTEGNTRAVAQVCSRLDGIPLALELAAARANALTVEQLAERLDDRFAVLTAGSRVALPRQQTLRATMDWSYDLLSESERTVLRRLSVFVGGCSLEAAEAVCSGQGIDEHDVLDLLTQLVNKSLVIADLLGTEVRYRMLDTIRQYAQDKLSASGEAAELQQRHRGWYLRLAQQAAERIVGPDQLMWLNRLELEHDNLRAALDWSSPDAVDAERRLRLAGALVRFWDYHTHWGEGRTWLEAALAESRGMASAARTTALEGAGFMAWRQGDLASATALYDENLSLARELGDQKSLVEALVGRGVVAVTQGNLEAATGLFEESLELAQRLEEPWLIAMTLAQLGVVIRWKGDYSKAVALCERSLAMYRRVGGKRGIAYSLRLLGHATRLSGDPVRATEAYRESLALFHETADKWVATECIEGLALIANAHSDEARAARLLGAVEAARERFGIKMPRPERGAHDRFGAADLERLKEKDLADVWTEGRTMTLEQAVAVALEDH